MRKHYFVVFLLLMMGFDFLCGYQASTADLNEINEVARIAAESFSYYKSLDPTAGNFYVGQNQIEGQCGDYALRFVLLWNERHPSDQAELVAVNQGSIAQSGSYRVVEKRTDFDPSWWDLPVSGFARYTWNDDQFFGMFHPEIGFYELRLSKAYVVTRHFGVNMTDEIHVWAKVGDIIVDPTYADTGNTSFTGIDSYEPDDTDTPFDSELDDNIRTNEGTGNNIGCSSYAFGIGVLMVLAAGSLLKKSKKNL
jgi:hypothetical protein